MSALREEFDHCEVYSVDEAFFVLPDAGASDFMSIRERIITKTGIPVSIGVAKTKTLAKVANSLAKKSNGVCVLTEALWKESAEHISCGGIWGIGRQTTAQLAKMGIHTAADFINLDIGAIRRTFGVVGERLYLELSGISTVSEKDTKEHIQESYMSTRSFGQSIFDEQTLVSAIGYHVTELTRKLRKNGHVAGIVTVIVRGSRYGDFGQRKGSVTAVLMSPTHETSTILKKSIELLHTIYDSEIPYKKAGVILSGITPVGNATNSLFSSISKNMITREIDSVTDDINQRFGKKMLQYGVLAGIQAQSWESKKDLLSQEYTTKWNEIPVIKAK